MRTINEFNKIKIQQDSRYRKLLGEMKEAEVFINDFAFLTLGRDSILCKNWVLSLQTIITSAELTVGSIIKCCECGCIADANCLLRKYRDDLFFYLYIVVYDTNRNPEDLKNRTEMEDHIIKWVQDELNNLHIHDVLKAIGMSPQLKEVITIYGLQKSFRSIGERLNCFVHGNGFTYYNRSITAYKDGELYNRMKALADDMKYITVTFMVLLILCSPVSVMSTDYIDYLEFGETPPEHSQYWVAPFIEHFISSNTNLIDQNCYNYLAGNTSMQFGR